MNIWPYKCMCKYYPKWEITLACHPQRRQCHMQHLKVNNAEVKHHWWGDGEIWGLLFNFWFKLKTFLTILPIFLSITIVNTLNHKYKAGYKCLNKYINYRPCVAIICTGTSFLISLIPSFLSLSSYLFREQLSYHTPACSELWWM